MHNELKPEMFLDPKEAPEFSHKLAVAHFLKNREKLEVLEAKQQLHNAERTIQRNNRLLAKGQQYMRAFEAKQDVMLQREYFDWAKEQEVERDREQRAAEAERERQRKLQMKDRLQEFAEEKAAEVEKFKADLNRISKVRNELRQQTLEMNQTKAREIKEQGDFNRSTMRNRISAEVVQRSAARQRQREEADALFKTRKPPSLQRPTRPISPQSAPSPMSWKAVTAPPRAVSVAKAPRQMSTEDDDAEIERLMAEMGKAQDRLRESRKEFELATLKTAKLVPLTLGTMLPRNSPKAPGSPDADSRKGFFLTS